MAATTSQDPTTAQQQSQPPPQDQDQDQQKPWHAAFPAPRLEPGVMPKQRAQMVLSMKIASMLIIDVRRTDYEGGAIRGSLNIPAQGFWWNRGMLYELAYKSNIEWVVFTCNSCTPGTGRGPRCAAWFLEHVREVAGDNDMQVLVLEGGIKGWVKGGPPFTGLMDGFVPGYWEGLVAKGEEEKAREEEKVEGGGE